MSGQSHGRPLPVPTVRQDSHHGQSQGPQADLKDGTLPSFIMPKQAGVQGDPSHTAQSCDLHLHIWTKSWTRCSLRSLPTHKFITMFQLLLKQIFMFLGNKKVPDSLKDKQKVWVVD